jgi:hypothetical protein
MIVDSTARIQGGYIAEDTSSSLMTFVQEDTRSKTLCHFSGQGGVLGGCCWEGVRGEVVEAVRYGMVG